MWKKKRVILSSARKLHVALCRRYTHGVIGNMQHRHEQGLFVVSNRGSSIGAAAYRHVCFGLIDTKVSK
jgi:hypothetical protein